MDTLICPGCSDDHVAETLTVAEMMYGVDATFKYLQCATCATVRLARPPHDMAPYYPSDYYSVDLDPQVVLGKWPMRRFAATVGSSRIQGRDLFGRAAVTVIGKRQFQTMMSILQSVRRAGGTHVARVLDVGCGSGVLAYELGLAGCSQVLGVDPFASEDRLLDNGVRILRKELTDVPGQFDVVMFHHSLEHVPDPAAALRAGIERLAPGGSILVRMPTVSSAAFETYRNNWVQFDAPRHITIFSREGFATCAQGVGLTIADVTDDSTAFQFWGSEQVKSGTPLYSATSQMVDPGKSPFSRQQIRDWSRRADELNAAGRGDQAAWILRPA